MKLNIGPGPTAKYFHKLKDWETLDCEKSRAKSPEMVMEFNKFVKIPRKDDFYDFVYASHVLEHINQTKTISFLSEIRRVMRKDAVLRIIIPDAKKSMIKFLNGENFPLFERRKNRYSSKNHNNKNYVPMTNFEAMRGCFVSISGQQSLHRQYENSALAHQNAWDFESIKADLQRSGFEERNIFKSNYGKSISGDISYEKLLDTEARQFDRSLYVEVVK